MFSKITISAAALAVVIGAQDDISQKCSAEEGRAGCEEYNW